MLSDENTRSKFLFSGGNDYLDAGGLTAFISKEYVPDFLGGPCKVSFKLHFTFSVLFYFIFKYSI